MPRLIVTTGPLVGQRYEIDRELIIGGRDATLSIHDDAASPRHAAVRIIDDHLEVEDLGSSDGTWVDGERIHEPVILHDGATLRVGTTTFIVEIDAQTGERARTNPMLGTVALPALADPTALPPSIPYAAPAHPRRRRADTRLWLPAAASFAAIIATAVALVLYFALR
jgi:pSer/pThr/pTyr-binding forkhead associated (FHA) protein